MNQKQIIALGVVLIVGMGLATLVLQGGIPGQVAVPGSHGESLDAGPELVKGAHGGRLLTDGDLAIEVTIYEHGVPPQFRVYGFEKQQPVDPAAITLTIELRRIGGRVDVIHFAKKDDYLLGDQVVEEPHSFDVAVVAQYDGSIHQWAYASYEGRVALSPEAIESVVIDTAGSATITSALTLYGHITPNEDHLAHVIPRYPGVIKELRKRLGDPVAKDEVLAIVESNESLQRYDVRSAVAGTVIRKDVTRGEFAKEGTAIYTVADLSTVWADFHAYRRDFPRLKVGQTVTIGQGEGRPEVRAPLSYLSPIGAEASQTTLARVELPNPSGDWHPGSFVSGEIVVEEVAVPLAVRAEALWTFRDWDVVFINEGSLFEVRPLELGRRDGEWVEVLSGLNPGQRYATEGSFIIKADIGKSGATHDH